MTAEHPWAVAILLEKRKPKQKNVLIGSDRVVIKALERLYSLTIGEYDPHSPKVFSTVEIESEVPLEDHTSCTFWRNPPISKNDALLNYIVSALTPTVKDKFKFVKTLKFLEGVRDFDTLYWSILTSAKNETTTSWDKQPWESATWVGSTDVSVRLARLYHDLRAWVYVWSEAKVDIKTLNLSTGKITYLKKQKLGINLVAETLSILAKWRYQKLTSPQAALLITGLWSPNGR